MRDGDRQHHIHLLLRRIEMLQFFVAISALLVSSVAASEHKRLGLSTHGWTYKTTPSTCAATDADPCGPVS